MMYACYYSGLKDKEMDHLELMGNKHAMKFTLKHCNCVVDLLGQSACLDEGEDLIKSMLITANHVIWKTLSSAHKSQKKVEMVKHRSR